MYYTIKTRTDKEVGSVFPQASCLSQMHAHQLNSQEIPKSRPKLIFELNKRAKITDVLSQAAINAMGLLVNEKTKKIIEKYSLIKHKFFPATVKSKKGELDYFWLHLSEISILDEIVYDSSNFFRTKFGFRKEDLKLSSFQDYKAKKIEFGRMGTIESDYLFLNKEVAKFQVFAFPYFDYNIYIHDELYKHLVSENITGIEVTQSTTVGIEE